MTGPLSDLLVVDLTRALAGPHATQMLGDLGARVIKVEAPGSGDDTRGWGPPFVGEPDARQSTYFLCTNRNKESIALDLKDAADKDVLLGLVDRADVLVENFRTGVLERLGLGIEELMRRNPRLVVLSITGFGHDGPEGGRAGYDQIAQGEAGLMSLTGSGPDDPQRVGVPIADLLSGMYGAYGVLAALHERHETGKGTGRADVAARLRRRRARLPGHPLDGRRRGRPRAGQPPPLDRPLRAVPLPRRRGADRARQRGPVEEVLRRLRARPRGRGSRHQRRARRPARARDRGRRAGLRRLGRRAAARAARRGRRAGGQGAHPRRGLRVGPGRQPGPARRRRAPDPRRPHAARPAAAVLRRRRRRGHPTRPRGAAAPRPARRRDPRLGRRRGA